MGASVENVDIGWLYLSALFSFLILQIPHFSRRRFSNPNRFVRLIGKVWPADHETLLPAWLLPLLPLILAGGAYYFQAALPAITPSHVAWYNDLKQTLVIEGRVVSDPEFRDTHTLLVIEVENLILEENGYHSIKEGRLLARMVPGDRWRYGDKVRVEGRLQTPFETEGFSYKNYLAHRDIYSVIYCSKECGELLQRGNGNPIKTAIYSLRRQAVLTVYQLFPDPEASLLAGILLGVETGIPENVIEAFRRTGTAHIIAISGFNFAIIAGLLVKYFSRFLGPWYSLPAAWLGIGLYAVLAGAGAGVVRAAVMGSLSLIAFRIGRRSSGVNTLAFVAFVMTLFDPHVLWDVSFQLSFMATLGLILYAEPLAAAFKRLADRYLSPEAAVRLTQPVSEYLLFTFAAQVTTLPLILHVFGQASLVSLLANPLVLPAQPLLMVLGGQAVLFGMIIKPLGQFIAFFAWPFIAYSIRIVEMMAKSRPADLTAGPISIYWLVGFYGLLFVWTMWGSKLKELAFRRVGLSSVRLLWASNLVLCLLSIIVWRSVLSLPDGRLHLTVLDVGDGEALLIRTPTGRSLLVNGGSSPNQLADALGRRLPITNRAIDFLIVDGNEEYQIAALPSGLDQFDVRQVLWAGPKNSSYSARELQKKLFEQQIPILNVKKGQVMYLGELVHLEITAVTPRGAVLWLHYKNFQALLPLGLDFESMEILKNDHHMGPMAALLLADGGYAPLNPLDWIKRWQPRVILISAAAGSSKGLPDQETMSALTDYTTLRTDQNGWIELSTDGNRLWVDVEKK